MAAGSPCANDLAAADQGAAAVLSAERWETPDGDFIDLDWVDGERGKPCVALFHGLEGSSRSHYARRLMQAARERGWHGVVVHFRGCSGEANRLARAYHSGDSTEIDWVLRRLGAGGFPALFAAGVSLGGNALLKWAAELGADAKAPPWLSPRSARRSTWRPPTRPFRRAST
jgi:predicted alpha/beta-fold hydrolase